MAKYNVTFSCGHTAKVDLFGKNIERQRRIKYFETYEICPECKEKEKEEWFEQLAPASDEYENMAGTEKQKKWAVFLIDDMNEKFDRIIEECGRVVPDKVEIWKNCKEGYNRILKESSAHDVIYLLQNVRNITSPQEYYKMLRFCVEHSGMSMCARIFKEVYTD